MNSKLYSILDIRQLQDYVTILILLISNMWFARRDFSLIHEKKAYTHFTLKVIFVYHVWTLR